MAKARHLWETMKPDQRHVVDRVWLMTERERKPRENPTAESRWRKHPRPILAQNWCRGKIQLRRGFCSPTSS